MTLDVGAGAGTKRGLRLDRAVTATANIRVRALPEAWGREGYPGVTNVTNFR